MNIATSNNGAMGFKIIMLFIYNDHFQSSVTITYTEFPRNSAAARFNFKVLYHVVTIRGQLDFKGGVYRDLYACTYIASIVSPYIMCLCKYYISVNPVPCSEIEGGGKYGTLHTVDAGF